MSTKQELNLQIGERVRADREKSGFTQERLAELIDVSTQYISSLERGTVGLSVPTLVRLCQVLHVSADSLLFEPAAPGDTSVIAHRLTRLPPEQVAIAEDLLNKYLEGLAVARVRWQAEQSP